MSAWIDAVIAYAETACRSVVSFKSEVAQPTSADADADGQLRSTTKTTKLTYRVVGSDVTSIARLVVS